MRQGRAFIVAAIVCAISLGCSFDAPFAGVASAEIDATPGTDAAPPPASDSGHVCDPSGADDSCVSADALSVCRADGSGFDTIGCLLGCEPGPPARCADVVPANSIPRAALDEGTADLDTGVVGSIVVFTDTGLILDAAGTTVRPVGSGYDAASGIGFRFVAQGAGEPGIGVFSFHSLHIAGGSSLRAIGANALAIAAGEDVMIDGTIEVTGGPDACDPLWMYLAEQCPGPGGLPGGLAAMSAPGSGAGGGGVSGGSLEAKTGGGGGGHSGSGGSGGTGGGFFVPGGSAGPAFGAPDLSPLSGGGGGGGGGTATSCGPGGHGGGGGGAVQVTSRTVIALGMVAGLPCGVNAGGGGAGGSGCGAAGGGGAAGGAILLEAPSVVTTATCVLAANGGGGGGANDGSPGSVGLLSSAAAAGGAAGCSFCTYGGGGSGGAGAGPDGATPGWAGTATGGGGGGVGAIHIRTLDAMGYTAGAVTSPPASFGAITVE